MSIPEAAAAGGGAVAGFVLIVFVLARYGKAWSMHVTWTRRDHEPSRRLAWRRRPSGEDPGDDPGG